MDKIAKREGILQQATAYNDASMDVTTKCDVVDHLAHDDTHVDGNDRGQPPAAGCAVAVARVRRE